MANLRRIATMNSHSDLLNRSWRLQSPTNLRLSYGFRKIYCKWQIAALWQTNFIYSTSIRYICGKFTTSKQLCDWSTTNCRGLIYVKAHKLSLTLSMLTVYLTLQYTCIADSPCVSHRSVFLYLRLRHTADQCFVLALAHTPQDWLNNVSRVCRLTIRHTNTCHV